LHSAIQAQVPKHPSSQQDHAAAMCTLLLDGAAAPSMLVTPRHMAHGRFAIVCLPCHAMQTLSGVILQSADFSGSNLSGTQMARADARGANLSGVDFTDTNAYGTQVGTRQ
jgi:hypothetical protein